MRNHKYFFWISVLIYYFLIFFIGYEVPRDEFVLLFSSMTVLFLTLLYWWRFEFFNNVHTIWWIAVGARVILLFSVPLLSDDYFRFIWDGQLLSQGINPFHQLPSDMVNLANLNEVYAGLNSKNYFSVYPPVMQGVFGISSLVSGGNLMWNIVWLKLFLLIADVGVIYYAIKILKRLNINVKHVLLYALNPLVIVETVGNLHFEGMMMFFTLWAIYQLMRWRGNVLQFVVIALVFSLGVSTKIVSILFLPVLIRKLGWKHASLFGLLVGFFVVLSFMPFIDAQVVDNFTNSLDLYFRKFEFNASIYFLANGLYQKVVGWQEIKYVGPALALILVLIISIISFGRRIHSWSHYFSLVLVILTSHLLLSTTVHPWYVINLLVASMFTRHKYVVMWSWSVVLSYYFYLSYDLPSGFIILEYVLFLSYLIYELRINKSDGREDILVEGL